jgi:predicted secreted protein
MNLPFSVATLVAGLARIIGLLAVAMALAACSAVKLGYNNFDDFAYWWLDGYVDFTEGQSVRAREDLARILAWHRKQELPLVADLLQEMEQMTPGEVSAAQLCSLFTRFRERLNVLAEQAEPAATTLALNLSPDQLKHMEHRFEKKNADWRKDWVDGSPAKRNDKRLDQFLERGQMMYGSLEDEQRAVLRKLVEQSAFDAKRVLAERQARQQDLLQLLRRLTSQNASISDARGQIHAYIDRLQASPDPRHRQYQQEAIDEGCRNFSALHNSTTAPQRIAAAKRLRDYQRDLRELAAGR